MSTKIFLRRLTEMATFDTLQDKLTRLNDTYLSNSCDTNVSRCIDIIELNARVQRELYKLLNLVSAEGGVYGGASTIRSRLLPFLNVEASYLNGLLSTTDSDLYSLAWWRYPYAHLRTESEFNALASEYERNLNELDLDLRHANDDNARLEAELHETRAELIDERAKSTGEKMFIEAELANVKTRLSDAEFRLSLERYKPRSAVVEGYEREIRRLRNDIELSQRRSRARSPSPVSNYIRQRSLSPIRSLLPIRSLSPVRSVSPVRSILPVRSLSPVRSVSPVRTLVTTTSTDNSLQKAREETLIQRYNDLYSRERLNAMDTLRTVSADYDMNRRICFRVVQEAFSIAKSRFNEWKLRLRSDLAITHSGFGSLEDAVQDYINRNIDYYELPTIVSEIADNLYRNSRLSLPIGVSYTVLNTFIREAARVAWHMTCLAYPFDVAFATDSEVFDDTKYRRSYDSEYSAPLVDHHVWPALMQGSRVIVKGEACTKRGASLSRSRDSSPFPKEYTKEYRSLIRSRSISPIRRYRVTSPVRISPIYRYY